MKKEKYIRMFLLGGIIITVLLFPHIIKAQQKTDIAGNWDINILISELKPGDTLILNRVEKNGNIELLITGEFYRCEPQYYCMHIDNMFARMHKCNWLKEGTWELDNGQLKMNLPDKTIKMISIETALNKMKFLVKFY